MKKIFVIISVLIIVTNSFSQSGWFSQNSGTSQLLTSSFFLNSQTGWATGINGIIIKTTNGGTNWENKFNSTFNSLSSIYFIDSQTGWAVGYRLGLSRILKTVNGGTNWTELVNNNLGFVLTRIQFIDINTGWASGSGGYNSQAVILKSTNSGANWVTQYDTTGILTYTINDIFFANSLTGYAVGWNNKILKTTNGGNYWFYQNYNVVGGMFNTVHFLDDNTGFAAGSDIYKTTDGGNNWLQYGFNHNVMSIKMLSQNLAYASGSSGRIIMTTNGGNNWNIIVSGTTQQLYSINFVDNLTGWSMGDGGTILKTITGGITSIKTIEIETPSSFSLSQNYPNPFNPSTQIKIDIPKSSDVKILIYNMIGKEIVTLVNEKLLPGTYTVDWNASDYPSGVYFYRMMSGNFIQTKQMILLK